MMMILMMVMMNCFCGMVDRRKVFRLISSWDLCQRSSLSRISDTLQAGFEHTQNLSSGLVEWSCAVVITAAPRHHKCRCISAWPDIKDGHQRCQAVRCCTASKMSVSFRYQLKRLWRLKLVGLVYVPVRRHKDISNRSDELTYQLRRHDYVLAWSGMFKLVTKMDQFLLHTM